MPHPSICLTNLWILGQILQHLLSPVRGLFTLDGNGDSSKQKIDAADVGLRFEGNSSSPDYFRLLERDGNYLLVGARNAVYNISMENFDVQTLIFWPSVKDDVELCLMKGKSKDDCHNYIRILAKEDSGLLICGTNAFKPTCRRYVYKKNTYEVISEFSAVGMIPYDPSHQSTALFEANTMEVYAGTVADFSASDALISRCRVDKPMENGVRTERNDNSCLNDPSFISSIADSDHVYFWLHEEAVEFKSCGRATYSRVARVCKNDRGTSRPSGFWTSFAKLRLNCSLPGDFPFYFDNIVATSNIVHRLSPSNRIITSDESEVVYAVFDTPYSNSALLGGSAVCAFSMSEIRKEFSRSKFWPSEPRPKGVGDCNVNAASLDDKAKDFVRKNFLLEAVLPNYFNSPLIVQTGARRFTKIAVDPQVQAVNGRRFDVIFLSTDDGRILKMLNLIGSDGRFLNGAPNDGQQSALTITIDVIKIFNEPKVSINNMQIFRSKLKEPTKSQEGRLIVVSDELVRAVPLSYCSRASTCSSCVYLQDPYCAWDPVVGVCAASLSGWENKKYIQNVTSGSSPSCVDDNVKDNPTMEVANDVPIKNSTYGAFVKSPWNLCDCKGALLDNAKDGSYVSSEKIASIFVPSTNKHTYSIENLIFAILTASFTSCLVGFIIGLRLGKNIVCWPLILAKLGSKKCQSPALNIKGTFEERKPRKAIHRFFSIKSKEPHSNSTNGPINAYEYDPPKISDYKYLNESSTSTVTNNSFGTPVYCNKAFCSSISPAHNEANASSANPSSSDFTDLPLTSVPSHSMDTAPSTAYSNYCTLPKDYKVKKTYL